MSLSPIFLPWRSAPLWQKAHPPPFFFCSPLYLDYTCLCAAVFVPLATPPPFAAPSAVGLKARKQNGGAVASFICRRLVLVAAMVFFYAPSARLPPRRLLPRPRPSASKRVSNKAAWRLRSASGFFCCWLLLFTALLLLL